MLQDRFPELIRSIYNLKVLVNASYKAKQTLIGKGLTPAIFISQFYRNKLSESYEVSYGIKQKIYKPLPQFVGIDLQEYESYNEQMIGNHIKNKLQKCQIKLTKNLNKNIFSSRAQVQFHLNNQNFHWFQESNTTFLYSLSLNKENFKISTLEQPIGLVLIIQIDDKDLKEQFQIVKKQAEQMLKKIYQLNPSQIKNIKILIIILFDTSEGKIVKDALNFSQILKKSYGVDQNSIVRVQINGPNAKELSIWGHFNRPILHHKLQIKPLQVISLLTNESQEVLSRAISQHKNNIKTGIQIRMDELIKIYEQSNTKINKFLGFFKANSPTDKNYSEEEKSARQLADWYFLIEDYRNSYEVYKYVAQKMKNRNKQIQNNVQEMEQLCLGMSRYCNLKLKSQPYNSIEKHAQNLLKVYSNTNNKVNLLRYLIFLIYMFHAFRAYNSEFIHIDFYGALRAVIHDQKNSLSCVATLIHQQYASLSLLSKNIDYRHYCYQLARVSSKFMSLKLHNHALRCLLLVNSVYEGSFVSIEKYILMQISRIFIEQQNYEESFHYLRSAWKIHLTNKQSSENDSKNFLTQHLRYLQIIQKNRPDVIEKNVLQINIPLITNMNIELLDEVLDNDDKSGDKWQTIGQAFTDNKDMLSQGLLKGYFTKLFRQFDLSSAQQKSLSYQIKGNPTLMVQQRNSRWSYCGQSMKISLEMMNPFPYDLQIDKIMFKTSANTKSKVASDVKKAITIKGYQKVKVEFNVIPLEKGFFQLDRFQWMCMKVLCEQKVDENINHTNCYYKINIGDQIGTLQATVPVHTNFHQGENGKLTIQLANIGSKDIQNVYIAVGKQQIFGFKFQQIVKENLTASQRRKITFNIKIPLLEDKVQTYQKYLQKLVLLYRSQGTFRCKRLLWTFNIHRVMRIKDYSCERLSTKLHLLTLVTSLETQDVSIDSMLIRNNFAVIKREITKSGPNSIHYYFLRKDQSIGREIHRLQQTEKNYTEEDLGEIVASTDPSEVQVSFLWNQKDRFGRIDIPAFPVTFNRNIEQSKSSTFLPFNFKIKYVSELQHNFQSVPVLQIPIELKIKNIFNKEQLDIELYFTQGKDLDTSWQGIINRSLQLKEGQQITIIMRLIVLREGIFDLADTIKYIITQPQKPVVNLTHSQYQHLYLKVLNYNGISINSPNPVITTQDLI